MCTLRFALSVKRPCILNKRYVIPVHMNLNYWTLLIVAPVVFAKNRHALPLASIAKNTLSIQGFLDRLVALCKAQSLIT